MLKNLHKIRFRLFIWSLLFYGVGSQAMELDIMPQAQKGAWECVFTHEGDWLSSADEHSFAQTNISNHDLVVFIANQRKEKIKKFISNSDKCQFSKDAKIVWQRSGRHLGIADIRYKNENGSLLPEQLDLYSFGFKNNAVEGQITWQSLKGLLPYNQFPFFDEGRGWCFYIYQNRKSPYDLAIHTHGWGPLVGTIVECSMCRTLDCMVGWAYEGNSVLMSDFINFPVLLKAILDSPYHIRCLQALSSNSLDVKQYFFNDVIIPDNYKYFQEVPYALSKLKSFYDLPERLRGKLASLYEQQKKMRKQ